MSLLKRLGGNTPEPAAPTPTTPTPTERMPEYRSSSLTPLSPAPPPPPSSGASGLSALAGLGPQGGGGSSLPSMSAEGILDITTLSPDTQQQLLELSLGIVDKIQASLGSQTAGSVLRREARGDTTLVVYMAGRQIATTAAALIAQGLAANTPIAVLESVSLPQARHWRAWPPWTGSVGEPQRPQNRWP